MEDRDLTAANVAAVHRLLDEVFNGGNLAVVDELAGDDLVFHSPTLAQPGRGGQAIKDFVRGLRTGFPDLRIEVQDVVADEDRVAVRWHTTRQTHRGWYLDIPPTGRQLRMTGIEIFRFADGRIQEVWLEIDALGGLLQMGVLPRPGLSTGRRVKSMLWGLCRLAVLEARHRRTKPRPNPARRD